MAGRKKKSPLWMLVPVGALIAILSVVLIVVTLRSGKGAEDEIKTASAQTENKTDTEAGSETDSAEDKAAAVQEEESNEADTPEDAGEETEETPSSASGFQEEVVNLLESMTAEEKVAQLFFVRPEAITGVSAATAAGEATKKAFEEHPVGGIVYFAQNIQNPTQVTSMLANTQEYADETSGFPVFLGVDEEGGQVARIAGNANFDVTRYDSMRAVGESGNTANARTAGTAIGSYLKELGFNMDFAPVTDVLTNPSNVVIGDRSFGEDAEMVGEMAGAEVEGLQSAGVSSCIKHFPGHGGTSGDTHEGVVVLDKTMEMLEKQELLAFQKAMESEPDFMMVAHISLPKVLGDDTPCSLSKDIITGLIREKYKYDGIIITDALDMNAISDVYDSAQAALKAFQAGADMLLMPQDFQSAYDGTLSAVKSGEISQERLDESVGRILRVKTKNIV